MILIDICTPLCLYIYFITCSNIDFRFEQQTSTCVLKLDMIIKFSLLYTLQINIENQLRRRAILNVQNLAPSMYCNMYVVDLVFYLDVSHRWNSTDFTWPEWLYTYQGQLCIQTQNSFHLIQKSSRSFLYKKLGKIKCIVHI